jgi:hypothetical protein
MIAISNSVSRNTERWMLTMEELADEVVRVIETTYL